MCAVCTRVLFFFLPRARRELVSMVLLPPTSMMLSPTTAAAAPVRSEPSDENGSLEARGKKITLETDFCARERVRVGACDVYVYVCLCACARSAWKSKPMHACENHKSWSVSMRLPSTYKNRLQHVLRVGACICMQVTGSVMCTCCWISLIKSIKIYDYECIPGISGDIIALARVQRICHRAAAQHVQVSTVGNRSVSETRNRKKYN